MQLDVHVKEEFPYKVELCASLRVMADNWLHVNVPDTGDEGDRDGWLWDRGPLYLSGTHTYSFKHEQDALQFSLTWS